jgi:hypothetical protein
MTHAPEIACTAASALTLGGGSVGGSAGIEARRGDTGARADAEGCACAPDVHVTHRATTALSQAWPRAWRRDARAHST